MYYELVFETGTKSVAFYETDEEMFGAVKAHNERALKGEVGGPSGHTAERIHHVEKYEDHPGNWNVDETMSADVAKKELSAAIEEMADGGVVSIPELGARIRNLSNPMVEAPGPQESAFKAESVQTFTEGWE